MRIWVGLLWAAVALLPWYGFENLSWAAMTPLVGQLFAGKYWLAPLVVAPVLASTARPRLCIAAAVSGLGWLAIESLAIIHRGPGLTQPALGWGALVYATACLGVAAYGLARLGWMRGDVFVSGSLLLVVGAILLFVAIPVGTILLSALRDNDGHLALVEFYDKISDASIWGLSCLHSDRACGVAWNTLAQATLVGAETQVVEAAFQYNYAKLGLARNTGVVETQYRQYLGH